MPTYDYVCDACDHKFEFFQSMSSEVMKKCPECGRKKLRRLFGAGAGIVFKGSGFYKTDYRSESYKLRAKAESGESSGGKSESSSKPAESKSPSTPATGKGDAAKKKSSD